jgi:exoribonuclease-2
MLQAIARRAMLERGLLPDFSVAALDELARIQAPATTEKGEVRDLRGLLWASIDNDDSLDLDQLTVAEAMPGDNVKILVAVADVDSIVRRGSTIDEHARHNTHIRIHSRHDIPDASRTAFHKPHIPELQRGPAGDYHRNGDR